MGYVKPAVITRQPLPSDPDNYWVELKSHITYGEMKAATTSAVVVDAKTGEMQADSGKIIDAMALAYIAGWNVDDDAGNVLPVNADSLAQLADVDGNFVSTYANERLTKKAADQKN